MDQFRLHAAVCLLLCGMLRGAMADDRMSPVENSAAPRSAAGQRVAQLPADVVDSNPANPPDAGIPALHLTRVALEGEVLGDRVNLQATIHVTVNRGTDWHDVPLRLGQAHIWRHTYTGDGEDSPGLTVAGADEGLMWKVRGVGQHQLVFDMWVPMKRIPGGGQLQLSLPPLPPQFEASLTLQIPQAPVVLRTPRETTLLQQKELDGATLVEASVGGARLDLSWHPAVAPRGSLSQVRSLWTVTPEQDQLLMVVDQTLQFAPGTVQQFSLKLPEECTLVEVTGSLLSEHQADPDREGWYIVRLDAGTADHVDLRWQFLRDLDQDPGALLINGLDVEGAARQTGQIRFEPFPGIRVFPELERSRFVQRLENAVGAGATGPTVLGQSYEFLRQPFQLAVQLMPVVPVTTVRPVYDIAIQQDQLTLTAQFEVYVEASNVQQLEVRWPGAMTGWRDLQWEDEDSPVTPSAAGQLRRGWETPRTGRFVVRLRGTRTLVEDEQAFPLSLPVPVADHLLAPVIHFTSPDDVEPVLQGNQRPRAVALFDLPKLATSLPSEGDLYLGAAGLGEITLELAKHVRSVTGRTRIEPAVEGESGIRVHQRTVLDIQYGRLASFGLLVPEQLLELNPQYAAAETIRVRVDGAQTPLVPTSSGWRIVPQEPLKGNVVVDLEYQIPLPQQAETGEEQVNVPVIEIEEAELRELHCQIADLDRAQVAQCEDWGAVRTAPDGALWVARDPAVTELPLVVSRSLADASQQYTVERAYVRTR
ncbi:MAG: hypothetical protein KDA58_06585, partial [Planctomycetaceae bacterium]|nr:hypothetical protein [Planctomycetaceae bacterium]